MPDSYDWLTHTTSESGAQGLSGAWLARLGFLTFGLGVLWLSSLAGRRWGRWGQFSHHVFGVMMLATATFSHRPIDQDVVFDHDRDLLHSMAATAMGFAFAFGVLTVRLRRPDRMLLRSVVDVTALAASIIIPLSMMAWSGSTGLLQRTMFLIAYLWYATEAWETHIITRRLALRFGETARDVPISVTPALERCVRIGDPVQTPCVVGDTPLTPRSVRPAVTY